MPSTEAQKRAVIKYKKIFLKRIPLDVQKEKYDEWKRTAESSNESLNGFIKKAVNDRINAQNSLKTDLNGLDDNFYVEIKESVIRLCRRSESGDEVIKEVELLEYHWFSVDGDTANTMAKIMDLIDKTGE